MKVVINECFGGFGLSDDAIARVLELKGLKYTTDIDKYERTHFFIEDSEHAFWEGDLERNDPALVQVVQEMGEKVNNDYSSLKIIEIPDDVKWHIAEYDGREHVAENHRTWY